MSGARWQKLGLLYVPPTEGRHPKLATHAANPLPIFMRDDIYRVFFSGRDSKNRSSVGAVDIDIAQQKVVHDHAQPFFESGPEGSFYSDGVSIGNCYDSDGVRYMLFMGWQNSNGEHWRGDVGRLIVNPDLTLKLESEVPFLGVDSTDSMSLSYPWVMKTENGLYRMWYGSTKTWDTGNGEMLHVINHASSKDGHNWERHGLAIPYELGVAQAFSRPTVLVTRQGNYDMWFSFRSGTGEQYRIGHATSGDGKAWKLSLTTSGIDVSDTGWDSEMIEYPYVFSHKGRHYMLYNGNGYGKTGFGLAILSS